MNDIRIFHNADAIAAALDDRAKRQYPFALANGINRTLEEIQIAQRRKLPSQFTIRTARSRRFLEQLVYIGRDDRARKNRLWGIVGIQDPFGSSFKGKAAILAKFQFGGERRAAPGGPPIAVPTNWLRPSPTSTIAQRFYPAYLGVVPYKQIEGGEKTSALYATRAGKYLFRGKRRTFAVDPYFHTAAPLNTWGVYQRRGKGRESETFLLWHYTKRVRVPKRIRFLEDAQEIASQRLAINIEGQLAYALNDRKSYRARQFERVARSQGRL